MCAAMPPELLALPPRDVRSGKGVFTRNISRIKGLVASLAAYPALFLTMAILIGYPGSWVIWMSTCIDSIVCIFLAITVLQLKRAQRIFREGTAVYGEVQKLQSPAATGRDAAFINVYVAYQDGAGHRYRGQVSTAGRGIALQRGDRVLVVYLPSDPRRFALYDADMGLTPGRGTLSRASPAAQTSVASLPNTRSDELLEQSKGQYILGEYTVTRIAFEGSKMAAYTMGTRSRKINEIEVGSIAVVMINNPWFGLSNCGMNVSIQICYGGGSRQRNFFRFGLVCKASDPQLREFLDELRHRAPHARWIDKACGVKDLDGSTSIDLVVFPIWSLAALRVVPAIIFIPGLWLGMLMRRDAALTAALFPLSLLLSIQFPQAMAAEFRIDDQVYAALVLMAMVIGSYIAIRWFSRWFTLAVQHEGFRLTKIFTKYLRWDEVLEIRLQPLKIAFRDYGISLGLNSAVSMAAIVHIAGKDHKHYKVMLRGRAASIFFKMLPDKSLIDEHAREMLKWV